MIGDKFLVLILRRAREVRSILKFIESQHSNFDADRTEGIFTFRGEV